MPLLLPLTGITWEQVLDEVGLPVGKEMQAMPTGGVLEHYAGGLHGDCGHPTGGCMASALGECRYFPDFSTTCFSLL